MRDYLNIQLSPDHGTIRVECFGTQGQLSTNSLQYELQQAIGRNQIKLSADLINRLAPAKNASLAFDDDTWALFKSLLPQELQFSIMRKYVASQSRYYSAAEVVTKLGCPSIHMPYAVAYILKAYGYSGFNTWPTLLTAYAQLIKGETPQAPKRANYVDYSGLSDKELLEQLFEASAAVASATATKRRILTEQKRRGIKL